MHTAATGREALELVATNAHMYSLCLIDAVLPDIELALLFSRISEIVILAVRQCKSTPG